MPTETMYGKTKRISFAKSPDPQDMPSLLEVQKKSYNWFLEHGLKEVFKDVAAITDYTGNLELSFIDFTMDENPKYSVEECKARDATYAAPLRVSVRLRNKETEEIKEQEIFMGDFPLMTDGGTFVINGAERVIVSQIIRSPGAYYAIQTDKNADQIYSATVIPYRGAWLEYETDASGVFYVRIDKNRKIPITWLLRAMGQPMEGKAYSLNTVAEGATGGPCVTTEQLIAVFGEDERLLATLDKDPTNSREEALIEIYRKLRPGDPPTLDSAQVLLENLFFDPRRYDISAVGRYKFNKKLALATRLNGQTLFYPVADPQTGEILAEAGETLTRERAQELEAKGVVEATLNIHDKAVKVFSNGMVPLTTFVDCNPKELGIGERVRLAVLKKLMEEFEGKALLDAIRENADTLVPKHIIVDDIYATVNYLFGLGHGIGGADDIDHLGNRRMRSVGELLQNQFRVGFSRMERVIRERMTLQDLDIVTPQSLINIRPVTAAI